MPYFTYSISIRVSHTAKQETTSVVPTVLISTNHLSATSARQHMRTNIRKCYKMASMGLEFDGSYV